MIRPAEQADIADLLTLCYKMHKESSYSNMDYNEYQMRAVLHQLINNNQCVLVSVTDKKITGMFVGYKSQSFFGKDWVANDLLLYVLPEHRGSITAARLIKAFTEWAERQPEVKQIRPGISTGEVGEKAIGLYERLGYRRAGVSFWKEK